MTHCCSQCSFTAQFESALMMHHQLHHEAPTLNGYFQTPKASLVTEKSNTVPRTANLNASFSNSKENKSIKSLCRSSSATRLLEKLRTRIQRTRSKTLFAHPEEATDSSVVGDKTCVNPPTSEGIQKGLNLEASLKRSSILSSQACKETYGCHLCSFDADRITVLDRHLLNDHKIGLDNLLKLVMAKTREGLAEDYASSAMLGLRQPYYRPQDEIIEEGEFVIETVAPKIKILKHASTNTETQWTDIPDLKDNCRMISKELEKLMNYPHEKYDKEDFLTKMQSLNECMGKFVESTNTLKKVLTKELDSKTSVRERLSTAEPFFELGLNQDSPREWERAHSEKMERNRNKHSEDCRSSKPKFSTESFYY